MAAGLGFKTFNTGDVLSAADVNGYLMQGVLVFADATARDAAITSPQEGQFAYTKDNNSLWYYSGSAWVASGATGDIEGVTAGVGISGGGTSGTVTVTNSMATAIDAKGDLVVGTGADTFSKLTVGANGTTLVADSSEATGLKWATPAAGGINAATNTVNAEETSTSDSFGNLTTSGPAVTITTGTKVLVMCTSYIYGPNGSAGTMDFDISGATSRSATGVTRLAGSNEGQGSSIGTRSTSVTYLTVTAGSNTFTAKYFKRGTSATFDNRSITVIDLGS